MGERLCPKHAEVRSGRAGSERPHRFHHEHICLEHCAQVDDVERCPSCDGLADHITVDVERIFEKVAEGINLG